MQTEELIFFLLCREVEALSLARRYPSGEMYPPL